MDDTRLPDGALFERVESFFGAQGVDVLPEAGFEVVLWFVAEVFLRVGHVELLGPREFALVADFDFGVGHNRVGRRPTWEMSWSSK